MSKSYYDVKLQNGKTIKSLCSQQDCTLGGLGKRKSNSNLVVCQGDVKEKENSFLLFTPECIEQIGPYHQINLRDQEIFDFLVFVGVLKKGDKGKDKLSLLYNWAITTTNISSFTPLNTFIHLFMTCKKVVEDEYFRRTEHLQKCVCLSNKGHSQRLEIVYNCYNVLNKIFFYTALYFNQINSMFDDSDLCEYFLKCKYNSDVSKEFFESKVRAFTNSNFKYLEFDREGKLQFSSYFKKYNDFLHFLPFHSTVKDDIENIFFDKMVHLVQVIVNNVEMYNRTKNPFLSCIEIDSHNNFKKIGVNYDKLGDIIFNKSTVRINPLFLEKLVEEKFKVGLYKACFTGLLKYHQNLMFQLCRNLDYIQMDSEIKDFLKYLCGLIPSSGILSTLNFSDIESIKNAIKTFPLFGKAYSSFVQSTPPPEGTKTTGDFNKDMKHLPLDYLIQFIVYYEKNWKDFQSSFELTPKRSKSQKPTSANKKQKLINK